ncbi:hypothetical protein FN846DRAFT_960117 [Sphaerosporella brunnea]|uniref:Nudix hydrolase domain-containing protein n=1 Tax=Sphaerosporella brunnea TaxID=1250544 RepID=A0A5J5EQP7_9PEZI|nr:hypothetical protein FN846DRAFT_960117 [Sphaerosporella brunnea]
MPFRRLPNVNTGSGQRASNSAATANQRTPNTSGQRPSAPPPNRPLLPDRLPVCQNFFSTRFVFAASTLSYHIPSRRLLIIHDTQHPGTYLLPRGRKDVGETIETCAIRETLEEGGYRVELLRGYWKTRQPSGLPATARDRAWPEPHSEPFFLSIAPQLMSLRRGGIGTYLSHFFLAQIPEPALREPDYGAHFVGKHELGYDGMLVPVEQAVGLLSGGRLLMRDQRLLWKENSRPFEIDELEGADDHVVWAVLAILGWQEVLRVKSVEREIAEYQQRREGDDQGEQRASSV